MGLYMTGQKNKNEVIAMTTGTVAVEPKKENCRMAKSLAKAINRCPEQGSKYGRRDACVKYFRTGKKAG